MINLIFNAINFCILGTVIYLLFQKRIYPALQEQRLSEETSFKNLFKRHEALLQEKKDLEHGALQQQRRFEDLSQKIALWREHTQEKKAWRQEQQKAQEVAVQQRRKQQQEEYAAMQLQSEVVPQALGEAQQELERIFNDKAAQRAYMQKVLAVLQTKEGRG